MGRDAVSGKPLPESFLPFTVWRCYSPTMRRRLPLLVIGPMLAACTGGDAVSWEDVRALHGAVDTAMVLGIGPDGGPVIAPAPSGDSAVGGRTICPGSVIVTDDGAGGAFAAWWEERPSRSVVLLVARRSRDGERRWGLPVVADDRDRGTRGCDRPPVAIAADGHRGHVHLAYFLEPGDGAGVYAGHSMEDGSYFHGPVAIVYGDRPARTAVAVEGDVVVYAHEDPNSIRRRVALAISTTAGHLIEHRLAASPPSVGASAPLVAVRGTRIAVAWTAAEGSDASMPRAQVRIGAIPAVAARKDGGGA